MYSLSPNSYENIKKGNTKHVDHLTWPHANDTLSNRSIMFKIPQKALNHIQQYTPTSVIHTQPKQLDQSFRRKLRGFRKGSEISIKTMLKEKYMRYIKGLGF